MENQTRFWHAIQPKEDLGTRGLPQFTEMYDDVLGNLIMGRVANSLGTAKQSLEKNGVLRTYVPT